MEPTDSMKVSSRSAHSSPPKSTLTCIPSSPGNAINAPARKELGFCLLWNLPESRQLMTYTRSIPSPEDRREALARQCRCPSERTRRRIPPRVGFFVAGTGNVIAIRHFRSAVPPGILAGLGIAASGAAAPVALQIGRSLSSNRRQMEQPNLLETREAQLGLSCS